MKFRIIQLIGCVLGLGLCLGACNGTPKTSSSTTASSVAKNEIPEPAFFKQGELSFFNPSGKSICSLDIEIADDNAKRVQGLMYRKFMEDSTGMLFIFEDEEKRNFWMKNTYIPLDIIYVGADKSIVTIIQSAEPMNLKSLPSEKPAMYVVEVNGGYCAKYGINVGDKISFERF